MRIGQTLLGQFRVDEYLASGGMGAVYRVWDLKRNAALAMKVLHADLAEDPSTFKRFKREARALERLAHPNIVPFYGLYQAGDVVFLLERFIDGPSLKDVLRESGGKPLPVDQVLVYLKAMTSALGYAHSHGVVHCDVKPGNVMLDRGGAPFLADFGVARHADSTTTTLGFSGTVAYMAPEQCRADPVVPETDIYALGVVLFEMVTGQRPFRGGSQRTETGGSTAAERIRSEHLHAAPPDPSALSPALPESFSAVILTCLAKKPDDRYRTMRDLFEAACTAAGVEPTQVADRGQLPPGFSIGPEVGKAYGEIGRNEASAGLVARIDTVLPGHLRRGRLLVPGGVGIAAALILILLLIRGPWMPRATTAATTPRIAASVEPSMPLAAPPAPPSAIVRTERTATPRPGSPWMPVAGCPDSRIRVGNWTRVGYEEPQSNRVRSEPVYGADNVVGSAAPGTVLQVLDGPVCDGGLLYWLVRTDDGDLEGWTAEGDSDRFYLDPGWTQ